MEQSLFEFLKRSVPAAGLDRQHLALHESAPISMPHDRQWITEGRVDVSPIITHRFPRSQIQEAFELFRDRRDGAIKVIVDFPAKSPS